MTARKAPVATPVKVVVRWRALTPNGLGHAFTSRGTVAPALCGAKNQAEIHDWPRRSKCPSCETKAAAL